MTEIDTKAGIAIGAIIALIMGIFSQTIFAKQEQVIIQDGIPNTENANNENPNIACTYLIYIVSNVTKEKNCQTGILEQTSNDAYTVIEKTIIKMPTQGGIIYVKQGTYDLRNFILVNQSNIQIKGEGQGTAFTHGTTAFRQGNGEKLPRLIWISGAGVIANTVFRDFLVDGNAINNVGASTIGILSQNTYNDLMQDISLWNNTGTGLYLQDSFAGHFNNIYSEYNAQSVYLFGSATFGTRGNILTGIYTDNFDSSTSYTLDGNVFANTFIGNVGQDDKGRCFYMFTDSGKSPHLNTFTGNQCAQLTGTSGLYAFDLFGAQQNSFTGNTVYNMGQTSGNTYDGFILHSLGGLNAINNTFTGNTIISQGVTNHMRYGFNEVNSLQDFNSYVGNDIAGMATKSMNISGIHSRTVANLGYNPQPPSTITAGASIWTYTNNDGYTEQMILSAVNGQTAETCQGLAVVAPATIGQTCVLDIGQSMTSTWAGVAPTFKKVPSG